MNEYSNNETELNRNVKTTNAEQIDSAPLTYEDTKTSNKTYNILSFVPTISFLIFLCLMLVSIAFLPVASINAFNLNENFGTIISAERFDEIPGLNAVSLVIIIVILVSIFYTILLLQNRFSVFKYKKFLGKPLYKFLELFSIIFILACLLLSISIINKIVIADDGIGLIKVGFYPIVTIVLSIACLSAVIISKVLCRAHENANPEILEKWNEERLKVKEKTKTKTEKIKKVASYGNKKSLKLLLVPVILLAVTFVCSTLNVGAVAERFTAKTFNADSLQKVLIEDSGRFEVVKSTIENAIGNPYTPEGSSVNYNEVVYYTDNYLEFLKKAELNQKYALLAIEHGDYRISGLLKQAKSLELESETLAYGKAEITYNGYGDMKEVVYNNVVIEGLSSIIKKLDTVKIYNVVEEFSDQTNTTRKITKLTYMATYLDGSFIYKTCENVAVVLSDGTVSTTYEGSYVGKTLKWQDTFGKYETVATLNN